MRVPECFLTITPNVSNNYVFCETGNLMEITLDTIQDLHRILCNRTYLEYLRLEIIFNIDKASDGEHLFIRRIFPEISGYVVIDENDDTAV